MTEMYCGHAFEADRQFCGLLRFSTWGSLTIPLLLQHRIQELQCCRRYQFDDIALIHLLAFVRANNGLLSVRRLFIQLPRRNYAAGW